MTSMVAATAKAGRGMEPHGTVVAGQFGGGRYGQ